MITHIDQKPFRIVKDDDWMLCLNHYPNRSRYQPVQYKPCEEPDYLDLPKDEFLIVVLLEGIHSIAPSRKSMSSRRGHRT
jgi:hypothetical protein